MGEVWRAHDPRLARDVAIKVLPEALASDPERLARFEREARTLAALNHPNIAQVYGLEEVTSGESPASGRPIALVMELVDGPTLADRIARGPIPVDEALPMARQIAEALETAHEQHIVHRDLKPANVKVRPDGTVKVLDFGLARPVSPDRPASDASQAPTLTSPAMTEVGVIVGTAAYMSPEQARGRPVDRRVDIWAFGCVLFEMLTGQRAFPGHQVTETMALVLAGTVDWNAWPAEAPPAVRHLVHRCLEKDPRRRLRDIGEARVMLESPPDSGVASTPGRGMARHLWQRAVFATGLLAAGGLAGSLITRRATGTAEAPLVSRTSIVLPEDQNFSYPGRRYVAISPTGTHVAYTATPGLWLRALADREARILPGTQGDARSPFFSPDGRWLGYYASGALWRVSITGGAPTRLVQAINPWSTSWGDDGTILYSQGPEGIWRIADSGGQPEQVIALEDGATAQGPQLLPGGEWVLFTLLPPGIGLWDLAQIVAQSLSTAERVVLVNGGRDGRYLPTGHLVYSLNRRLLVLPFDPATLEVGTAAVPLEESVEDAGGYTGAVQFDVAPNGTLAYVPASFPDRLALTWVDRTGREEMIPGDARAYRNPRVSHDGTRLAVSVKEQNDTNIWIGDGRGTFTPLTLDVGEDSFPVWTLDGSRVVFFSARNGGGLFRRVATGTAVDEPLVPGMEWRPSTWTRDGLLVYEQLIGPAIHVRQAGGGSEPQRLALIDDPDYFDFVHPSLSPDGRWLAYHSAESGSLEVYVRPFPNVDDERRRISTSGGYSPVWSRDGKELYYVGGTAEPVRPSRPRTGAMMAVSVDAEPAFRAGAPERLFGLRDYVFADSMSREYDVAPDGRFLMLKDTTQGPRRIGAEVVLVQHWLEEVRRLVPAN